MKYLVVLLGLCVVATTVYGGSIPCMCRSILDPVCGIDGQTYPSKCDLECAGVELDYTGRCGGPEQQAFVEAHTDKFLPPPGRK